MASKGNIQEKLNASQIPAGGYHFRREATCPAGSTTGYAYGCIVVCEDGSTVADTFWMNTGTFASATWTSIPASTSAAISGTTANTFEVNTDGNSVIISSSGLGADRTWTYPDESDETAGIDSTQTFTNKTLTSATLTTPTITTPTIASDEWVSAQHDHSNAASGGALSLSSALVGTNATSFEIDLDGSVPSVALGVGTTGNFTQTIRPAATITTGDVDLTLPDTANVDDSFVFVTLAQTLASKTLTDPTINAATITGTVTISSSPAISGTWDDLGTATTIDIDGGTVDGTNIGVSSAGSGAFTTLAASGATTLSADVAIADNYDLTINPTYGTGYLLVNGATSGGIKLAPMSVGTGITELVNQAGTYTVTLPNATCTLLGSTAANTFTAVQTIAVDDTVNTGVTEVLALKHSVSTTAGVGIGAQLAFYLDDSGDTLGEVADIEAVFTTATAGSEECDLVFKTAFDTGTVATALTIDASANELVLGEDTSLLTAMRIYPATTSYGSFLIKAGDDTGNYVTTLSNTITAGNITVTLPATAGALATTAGTNTWSGVNTFSAEPVLAITDAAGQQAAVTDVLSLQHINSATPAAGIGVGISFECTTADAAEEQGSIDLVFTDVGTGAEEADLVFSLVTAGTVREAFRMDADAGFVVGNAAGTSDASKVTAYPTTTGKGSLVLSAVDNDVGDHVTTIQNGQSAAATTITLPTADATLAILGANSFSGAQTFTAGILASGAVSNNFSGSSGAFLTSTGAVTIGPAAIGITGDVTLATTKSITATAGSGSLDFSVATGTTDTSTGANTLRGDVTIATGKDFVQVGTGTFATGTGVVSLLGDVIVKGDIDTASATGMTIAAAVATSLIVGAIDIDTQIQAEDLTLSSVNPIVFQLGATPTDTLELDNAAISAFAAAGAGIAGQAAYMGTEAGGAAATAGAAGGLFNLTTGAGSAALLGAAGGAGGALAFETGAGGASVTGTPALSGAITLLTGAGGATTTSGLAAASGGVTITTGDGGASASGANAGGAAGTIALNGGTGGADSDTSDSGGVGGPIALTAGTGGAGATGGVGGGVTIDAGAAGAGGGPNDGSIDIGTNNSYVTTVTGASLVLNSTGVGVLQAGGVDLLAWDDTTIAIAGAAAVGQDCYLGTEAGGVAATTGFVGGLLNITTGAGSDADTTQTAGAGGALALATGIGGNSTTGTAGASGAITMVTGTAGQTTTSGAGPASGDITIQTGIGGISKTAANGGTAGTIALTGGKGGLDEGASNAGGVGGALTFTAGAGGNSTTLAGAGGAVTINAGAAGTGGGSPGAGVINIGTTSSSKTTIGGALLVLNSTGVGVLQAGGVDLLAWDDVAITIAAAAATTAGQPCYLGTEAGGVASASAGAAGGLLNITTGAGSAAATTQGGGASGALALATGVGGNSTTGTPGVSGAITIATGVAGATTTDGVGVDSGDITIATGTGGASEAGANAGGNAGTIALTGGVGGEDVTDANVGGIGGAVTVNGGIGGEGALGGAGGAVTIDGGAAGSGGSAATGAITIGGTNAASVTIGRSAKKTKILGTFSAPQTVTLNFGDGAEDGDGAFTQGGGVIGGSDTTDTEAGATYCATYDHGNTEWVQLSTSSSGTDVSVNYQFFSDTKNDDDAVYFGAAAKFCEMAVDMAVVQNYGGDALTWEYADSATPTWATLTIQYDGSDATAQDGKRSFGRDGAISFIPPAAWTASQPNAVLAAGGYYIRARITTTANMGAAEATTNTVQHYIVTPNADAPTCPVTGTITEARVVNANTTVHDQNCEFLLWNVTQSLWSATAAHTWPANQKIDLFGSLTLAVTAADKLGIIVLDDNAATVNPQFHVELKLAAA